MSGADSGGDGFLKNAGIDAVASVDAFVASSVARMKAVFDQYLLDGQTLGGAPEESQRRAHLIQTLTLLNSGPIPCASLKPALLEKAIKNLTTPAIAGSLPFFADSRRAVEESAGPPRQLPQAVLEVLKDLGLYNEDLLRAPGSASPDSW